MAEVTYERATCVYPGAEKPAVDGLDLAVKDGEFVVMVGPSGCGKTTALRMLAGLEEIDDGSIRIDGNDMVGVPSRDRDIAMVFQNYALYPSKTVGENMGFALKMQGVDKEERARRRRAAVARAIAREPKFFCRDEPLSNLDAQLRVQTRTQIAELQRRLKITTVYVTHDQVEAMTMGDRVAVMRGGHMQHFASPTELYDHPATVFVAGFIGSPAMNQLDGTLTPDGISVGGASVRPPDAIMHAAQGHGQLVVGIRPEHLSIGEGHLDVQIDLVEDLGSDFYVYGHRAEDTRATIIVRAGREHPRPGEAIKVKIDTSRLHLFDAGTGLRIGE